MPGRAAVAPEGERRENLEQEEATLKVARQLGQKLAQQGAPRPSEPGRGGGFPADSQGTPDEMVSLHEVHERRAAYNQALFRSVNERLEPMNESFQELSPRVDWMCECFRTDCTQRIELTVAEYEDVRARPNRFAVAPDPTHVSEEVEDVVDRCDRFWTVEKRGTAAVVARRLDERAA